MSWHISVFSINKEINGEDKKENTAYISGKYTLLFGMQRKVYLPLDVCHVLFSVIDQEDQIKTKQDSGMVLAILMSIMSHFKRANSFITEILLRSDNAATYKGRTIQKLFSTILFKSVVVQK